MKSSYSSTPQSPRIEGLLKPSVLVFLINRSYSDPQVVTKQLIYSFFFGIVTNVVGIGSPGNEIDDTGGSGRDGNGPVGRGTLKDGNENGPVGRGPVGRGKLKEPVGRGKPDGKLNGPVGIGNGAVPVGRGKLKLPVGRGKLKLPVGNGGSGSDGSGRDGSGIPGSEIDGSGIPGSEIEGSGIPGSEMEEVEFPEARALERQARESKSGLKSWGMWWLELEMRDCHQAK